MFPKIMVPPNHPLKMRFSIINHPFLGYPYFWKHPYKAKPNFNGLPPSFMSSCPQKAATGNPLPSNTEWQEGHPRSCSKSMSQKTASNNEPAEKKAADGIRRLKNRHRHHQKKNTNKIGANFIPAVLEKEHHLPNHLQTGHVFSSRKVRNIHFINPELFEPKVLAQFPPPRDPGSPKLRMVSWNLNTLPKSEGKGTGKTPLAHHLTFGGWIHRGLIFTTFLV